MKFKICFLIAILLLSICNSDGKSSQSDSNTLDLYSSSNLITLTGKWAQEYSRLNKNSVISHSVLNDNSTALKKKNGLIFTDDLSLITGSDDSVWSMIVGRDIVIPVMNNKNNFLEFIASRGITAQAIGRLLTSDLPNFKLLFPNEDNIPDEPLHLFVQKDSIVLARVSKFLNHEIKGTDLLKIIDGAELISVLQNDPHAIGFCKLAEISGQDQIVGKDIAIVPVDKNGNGKIDYMENIYENLQSFLRGVWIGKYPASLSGRIYAISSKKPSTETELSFLNWILTDGQQYLNVGKYSNLSLSERQALLSKINESLPFRVPEPVSKGTWPLIILTLILLTAIYVVSDKLRQKSKEIASRTSYNGNSAPLRIFDENSVLIPKGICFDKTHTWAFMDKDGLLKIGLDDFLQHVTGTLTRIEMKKIGARVKRGEHLLTIVQKGKQLDIYSPVSGTIKAQNQSLKENPALVNSAPYDEGWIYTLEPANWPLEIQFLNMADKYKTGLKNEFTRLKDFFALNLKSELHRYELLVLQDGGSLKDNILEDLGPEIWENFQSIFMDRMKS